jgi:hypothetical protein
MRRSWGSGMRKLPVFLALTHVAQMVVENFGFVLWLSWPWIGALAITNIFQSLLPPEDQRPVLDLLLYSTQKVILLVGFSSIAVNWHRYFLIEEPREKLDRLLVDRKVWRYLGNTFLIMLVVFLPMMLSMILTRSLVGIPATETFNLFALIHAHGLDAKVAPLVLIQIAFNAIFYRFLLKLPAVALDRAEYEIGSSWTDTRQNNMRILVFSLGPTLMFSVPSLLFEFFKGPELQQLGVIGQIITGLIGSGIQWLNLVLGIAVLTSLYGFFAEKRAY